MKFSKLALQKYVVILKFSPQQSTTDSEVKFAVRNNKMSQMQCCIGVSIESVLQVVKFYTVVNNFKKTDILDCSPL